MKIRLSLLTKVLLIAFANLLALAVVFVFLIEVTTRMELESFLVAPAHDRVLALSRLLSLQLRETDTAQWDALLTRRAAENHIGIRLMDESGRILAGVKDPLPAEIVTRFVARHAQPPEARGRGRGHHGGDDDDHDGLMSLGSAGKPARHWAAVPAHVQPRGTWLVISSSGQDALFDVDATPWIVGGALVILISVAFWLPLVRGLTRSISRMTAATAQIAEGRFDTQLPAGRRDELGVLSASIAKMAAQLDRLVNGQKRFLRDAAHELRSPIGRMQVALGLLERSAAPGQQTMIQDLHDDVQQMSALVDDVLAYSRLGQRAVEPDIQDVPLASLVNQVLARDFSHGEPVTVSVPEALVVRADQDLLLRALSNVVRNAIRYAGPVCVSAKADGEQAVISVTDAGPGVPEKDLDAIFEPFYRLQSARERATGGVGLGLAITKSCIESCQGSICCRNRQPQGLEVEIRLPMAT